MTNKPSVDLYTKIVLTVIAVCLLWICFGGTRLAGPLQAEQAQLVDVRVRAIEPLPGAVWAPLPIESRGVLQAEITATRPVPVDIRNALVPVDVRTAEVKKSLTPVDK